MKTTKTIYPFLILICLLGFKQNAISQFADRLISPIVNVTVEHPPALGIKVNKIVFNQSSGQCADEITDALVSTFVSQGVEVIDRANLNAVLQEQNLSSSGIIDRNTALQLGKVLGPSAMLTVRVLRCQGSVKDNLYRLEDVKNPETGEVSKVKFNLAQTKFVLKVSVQTTDLTTGRIFTATTFDYAPIIERKAQTPHRPDPAEVYEAQQVAYNSLLNDVQNLFFPWTEKMSVTFFASKHCGMKEAYQNLKRSDTEGALNISLENLDDCMNSGSVKEKFKAYANYNVGLCYFLLNDFDNGFKYLDKARKIKNVSSIRDAAEKCSIAKMKYDEIRKIQGEADAKEQDVISANQAKESKVLTNETIISMTKQGISDKLILKKIETSECNFDTGVDGMGELKRSNVSDLVIEKMILK